MLKTNSASEKVPLAESPSPLLRRIGLITAGLYALLLIPTAHLLLTTGFSDLQISNQIEEAWRPEFFESLKNTSPALGKIIIHGFLFSVIGIIAWLYHSGSRLWPKTAEVSTPNTPPASFQQILFWTSLFSFLLLFVIPFHSKDIYGYINRGAEQAFYGLNPYLHPLSDVPNWQNSAMFHEHWVDNPSPYGFFFTRLAHRLCQFSGENFFFAFFIFKLNSVLLHLGSTYLIYLIGHRLNLSRPEFGAFLYGWNPLILLQIIGNGHNDLWVSFGVLLAIGVLRLPSWRWLVFPLLAVSIFTKYASILVLPFILIAFIRWKNWKTLAMGIPAALAITLALGWPYLQDWQHLPFDDMAKNAGMTQHSLNSMLSRLVYYMAQWPLGNNLFSIESLRQFFKPLIWGGFALFFGFQCVRFWQSFKTFKTKETPLAYGTLIYPMVLVLLVMITIASSKFHAWYLAMFFPLIFLLEENTWPRRFGLLLSYFQLLAFTPLQNIHVLNYLLLTGVPLAWSVGSLSTLKRVFSQFKVK